MAEEQKCDVIGCSNQPHRSMPVSRVSKYIDIGTGSSKKGHAKKKRVHICKDHYKEYKKKAKKDRAIERAYWD